MGFRLRADAAIAALDVPTTTLTLAEVDDDDDDDDGEEDDDELPPEWLACCCCWPTDEGSETNDVAAPLDSIMASAILISMCLRVVFVCLCVCVLNSY